MQVVFYENIEDFYKEFPNRLENNPLNTPFQYEDWQKNIYAEHAMLRKKIPYFGAILFNGNNAVLGGHFFLKKSGKHRGIFLLGSGGETDYYDLVYFSEDASEEHVDYLLRQIVQKTKYNNFTLIQVPDESILSKWAKKDGIKPYFVNECAWINLQGSYEEHLSSLSKNVRQNLRTANNRLRKDQHEATLNIYDEKNIPETEIIEIISLYESRRRIKNGAKSINLNLWIREKIRKWNKNKYNIVEEAMKNMKGKYLAIYKIDGIIASYCFGLKNWNDTCIHIMQVAINDDYAKYSPGMLMLIGVFQSVMCRMKGEDILFDLTNGNEKYKFSLGAHSHYTNYYKFFLNE